MCTLSVCVCVCVCVCVREREREREGVDYIHNANKERKARKSNRKSPHEESENHKNIRFQMQCNDIVILASKQKVKSNYRNINKLGDWNNKVLSKRFLKVNCWGDVYSRSESVWKYGNTYMYIYIYIYIYTYIYKIIPACR